MCSFWAQTTLLLSFISSSGRESRLAESVTPMTFWDRVHPTFTLPDNIVHTITSQQKRAVSHLWRDDNLVDTSERHFHSMSPWHFFPLATPTVVHSWPQTPDVQPVVKQHGTSKINSYDCYKLNGRQYHSVKILLKLFLAFSFGCLTEWIPNFEWWCSSPPEGAQWHFVFDFHLLHLCIMMVKLRHTLITIKYWFSFFKKTPPLFFLHKNRPYNVKFASPAFVIDVMFAMKP